MKLIPTSAEGWNTVFQTISVIFIAGTVLAGFGAIITGRIVSRKQARDLASANTEAVKASKGVVDAGLEIAKAKEGTAQAVRDTAKANTEIARLTKAAEQAKTERAEADKQIAVAKADAARAKEGIANAEALSAKAGVEVARLQAVVANAEQKRAEAERSLLEMQRRVNPRHLTAEQRTQLLQQLTTHAKKGEVTMQIFIGDGEAADFGREIWAVLEEAGWKLKDGGQNVELFAKGVALVTHTSATVPPEIIF